MFPELSVEFGIHLAADFYPECPELSVRGDVREFRVMFCFKALLASEQAFLDGFNDVINFLLGDTRESCRGFSLREFFYFDVNDHGGSVVHRPDGLVDGGAARFSCSADFRAEVRIELVAFGYTLFLEGDAGVLNIQRVGAVASVEDGA